MGRIPEDIIEDVLGRTDILQVVQQYVGLKRAGSNWKGLCPFHSEKTPSFNVHPSRGMYKCFGCGAAGNVFGFLMDMEGWSFPEVVRHLAGQHGIDLPETSEEDEKVERAKQEAKRLYYNVMDVARGFYEDQLWHPEQGRVAREYLAGRGISDETAKAFGLGYAPQGWQNVLDVLEKKRISAVMAAKAGLAMERQGSGHYDRFRHRIMFPVIDIWNHTLAFSGRVLEDEPDTPKYINSPETRFYIKGNQLFGLHAAKQAISKQGFALLVEGNFDVVALHAAGIETAIAPLGTAFTERQAKLLKRYAPVVILAFDQDGAGQTATLRSIEAIERAGLEGKVVRFIEPKDDPDTFVRREGPEAFERLLENAKPLIAWALERVMPRGDKVAIEDRLGALEQAAEILAQVRSPIIWKHYAEDLARRLDIEPRMFKQYLKRPEDAKSLRPFAPAGHEEREGAPHQPSANVLPAAQRLVLRSEEFTLLALLCEHPAWIEGFLVEQLDNLLYAQELASFLRMAHDYYKEHGRIDAAVMLERLKDPGFRMVLVDALASGESNDTLQENIANDKKSELSDKALKLYEDTLTTLKISWAERSWKHLRQVQEGLDFIKHREQYVEVTQQMHQLQEFRDQFRTNKGG